MSSPDTPARLAGHRIAAVLICLLVAGCFRPMYAEGPDGGSVVAALSDIYIPPLNSRVGQKVRNELLFAFAAAETPGAAYRLELTVSRSLTSMLVQPNRDSDLRALHMNARFQLADAQTGKILFSGSSVARASYEHDAQMFANERALINAEDRAARTVSDDIRTRLSAWFAARS